MKAARPAATASRRPLDRAVAALPLVLAYLLLCCLYAWQATQRDSPTIFTDELELGQISRAIADTGEAARRGVPYGFQTLYSFLVAPAWWIDDTASAYEAAKFIGVLVMTATIFPAYALARTIVSKPWALGAAVASAAIPALAYAPFLVEEPLAYPVATTALWLIARALARPTGWTIALAAAVCAGATLVRAQLAILIPVLALALALAYWERPAFRRARKKWTRGDYVGVVLLGILAALALSAFLGHRSEEWYRATGFYKERMFDYGLRALGSLVIGLGVLPFVAGLTAILTRRRDPDRNVRAFVLTSLAALFTFGFYTAVKAAYISTEFATVTVERNLIYVAPLLLAGTALLLERPGRRFGVIGVTALVALYVLLTTPFELDKYPYYDAPGLAIAALPNRNWAWDGERIEHALVVVLLLSVALLVARSFVGGRRAAVLAATTGALVVGWNLTAEIYAAAGQNDFSQRLHGNAPQPVDWLDRATGGEPALFLGDAVDDANGIHLLEFWNRSLKQVWSLDGSAPGPGPDADAEPRCRRRNPLARSRLPLGGGRERRRPGRHQGRRAARVDAALPARRPAPPDLRAGRDHGRRLDERVRGLQPVRVTRLATRLREDRALARGLLRARQAGSRDRQGRDGGRRAAEAAGDRTRPPGAPRGRPPVQGDPVPDPGNRALPGRGDDRADVLARRPRSAERRHARARRPPRVQLRAASLAALQPVGGCWGIAR